MWEWDFDKLTVEDALLMGTGEASPKQMYEMINRASVTGLGSIPATELYNVVLDFKDQFSEACDPKGKASRSEKESSSTSGLKRQLRRNT
jgi:hypothetical protein